MGRLIYEGSADLNTGIPGNIAGYTSERLLRAPDYGIISIVHDIGDLVKAGDILAHVNNQEITAEIDGIVRGMIRDGTYVAKGFKVGDVDPRVDQLNNCFTISDKAMAIGGAVLEALMIEMRRNNNL